MMSIGNHTNIEIEEGLLRHMILNSIRAINKKHREKYGELVIATDAMRSWRKDVFPFYKANRKKYRDQSELDWPTLFEFLAQIKDELKENFPYRVIDVDRAEADDIIATLAEKYHRTEPVLIISGDKDFRQLQKFDNVQQYDPVRKKWIIESDPARAIEEHIMVGDRGDGVPNFLSDDDCLVAIKGRQKPLRVAKLETWLEDPGRLNTFTEQQKRGYLRNKQLVDLSMIPEQVRVNIEQAFDEQSGKGRSKLFNYFIAKQLRNLSGDLNDF